MKRHLSLFALPLAALLLLGCLAFVASCVPTRHRIHHQTKTVSVHHLKDGRYAYRQDDGSFWFYMYLVNTNVGGTSLPQSRPYVNLTTATSLPRGGVWVSTPVANEAEEELAAEMNSTPAIDETIEVNVDGSVLTEAEVEAEGRDGMDISESESESSSSESTSGSSGDSSSSSDSSSSDSSSSDGP